MPSLIKKMFKRSKSKSKRMKEEERNAEAVQVPTENLGKVFKELDCPVCFNTCIPPIHSCVNGHIICNTCRENVKQCPSCRHGFTGTRNFFAENFITNCSQPCRYSREGCEFLKLKGDNMRPHEEQCPFRPISCLIPNCPDEIPYMSLLSHLTFQHKICGTDSLPALITFNADQPIIHNRKWLPFSIQQHGNVFFVMMEVIRPHFWIWVWMQTTRSDDSFESTFLARIVIKNDEKRLRMVWEGPVHSVRASDKNVMRDGLCFVSHEVYMQHFIAGGYFNFEVDIRKIPRRNIGNGMPEDQFTEFCASSNNNHSNSTSTTRQPNRSLYDRSSLQIEPFHSNIMTNDLDQMQEENFNRLGLLVETTDEQRIGVSFVNKEEFGRPSENSL